MTTGLADALHHAGRRRLEPLLARHGWERIREDEVPPVVLYVHDRTFLVVAIVPGSDRRLAYLQLRAGPIEAAFEPAAGVDLRQIERHRMPGIGRPELNRRVGLARFPANDRAEIEASAARLATHLQDIPELLAGDPAWLARVDAERQARLYASVAEWELEDARAEAERAWDAGDWPRAAELLASIPESERRASERTRLAIATRRAAAQAPGDG
jgi:hypothetical protein